MSNTVEKEVPDIQESKTTLQSSPQKLIIVLVGDGGTGKSSYIDRLNDGGFRKEYIATMGIEKHTVLVGSSAGNIEVTFYDTAGQEKFGPLRDEYYEGVDGAILFFDVTSRVTYKNIPLWHKDISRVSPNIPIALCANKVDIEPNLRKVKTKSISHHSKYNMGLFEISVKEKISLKEPVEYILQKIFNDPSLKIIGSLGTLFYDYFENMAL